MTTPNIDQLQEMYDRMNLIATQPEPGSRVIVTGWEGLEVTVTEVEYIESEARFKITLDWGEFGNSVVYDYDEGTVWRRFWDVN